MELWDLYNEHRERIGKDHIRGQELPDHCYHLAVHVWIKNRNGQYLISQRSASRPTYPLMWECVGGAVLKGESSLQGALREVKEEVGIDLIPENGKVVFSQIRGTVNQIKYNDIRDVWLFQYDGEVSLAKATMDEVAQVKWMTRQQMEELFDSGQFVDTLAYFFDKIDV